MEDMTCVMRPPSVSQEESLHRCSRTPENWFPRGYILYRSTKSETSAPPVGACFPVPKRIARQQFHKVQLAPYRSESPMNVGKDICLGKDVIDVVVQSCEIPEKVRERGLEEMIAQ